MRKSSLPKILESATQNQNETHPTFGYLSSRWRSSFLKGLVCTCQPSQPRTGKSYYFWWNRIPQSEPEFDSARWTVVSFWGTWSHSWVFIPIFLRMNASTRHPFREYLLSLQFPSFGRSTVPVVRRSWLVHGIKEMKQTFNLICNEFLPSVPIPARNKNPRLPWSRISSSSLWTFISIPSHHAFPLASPSLKFSESLVVSPPQSAYLAPRDEAVEVQYIASI